LVALRAFFIGEKFLVALRAFFIGAYFFICEYLKLMLNMLYSTLKE